MKEHTGGNQPKRHKLAFLAFLGLLLPAYAIPPAIESLFPENHVFALIGSVGLMVVLMSYLIMPLMIVAAGEWLRR